MRFVIPAFAVLVACHEGGTGVPDGGLVPPAVSGACVDVGEPLAQVCDGSWCLETPRTPIARPIAIAGSTERDIWLLRSDGALAHRGCDGWRMLPDAVSLTERCTTSRDRESCQDSDDPVEGGCGFLCSLAARSPTDAWLATSDALLHFDGVQWSEDEGAPTDAIGGHVWATAGGDVWLTHRPEGLGHPIAYRREASGWIARQDGALEEVPYALGALGGSAEDNVWAGDYDGLVRFDGNDWSAIEQDGGMALDSLVVFGPDDVWRGQSYSSVQHWDGASWQVVEDVVGTVVGASPNEVWAFPDDGPPRRFDGSSWRARPHPRDRLTAQAAFAGHVWAADLSGAVSWFEADRWWFALGDALPSISIGAMHGTAEDDVWAIADTGEILHRDGEGWSAVHALDLSPGPFESPECCDVEERLGVFARARDDVWVWGVRSAIGTVLAHWDGLQWNEQLLAEQPITQLWSAGPHDAWAVGGRAFRWDGEQWSELPAGMLPDDAGATTVFGRSDREVWIGGASGGGDCGASCLDSPVRGWLARWDGRDWIELPLPEGSSWVEQVSASDDTDLWVRTFDAVLLWDGTGFRAERPPGELCCDTRFVRPTTGDGLLFCGDVVSAWQDGEWVQDAELDACPSWALSLDAMWLFEQRNTSSSSLSRPGLWRFTR